MKKPLTTAFRLWSTCASAVVLAFSAAGKPDDGAPPRAEASISDVEKGTPAGWRALLDHAGFNRAAVWSQWAAADPAACYEELRRQPGWQKPLPAGRGFDIRTDNAGHLLNSRFLDQLFKGWLEKDPDTAAAAVDTVPGHINAARIRGQLLHHLLARDAVKAVPLIRRMAAVAEMSFPSADRWAITDHAALGAELQNLPGGPLCDSLLQAFAVNWSRKDAAAALVWLAGVQRWNQPRLLDEVLTPLTTAPPEVCMAALAKLPAGNSRRAAARKVAEPQGRTHGAAAWKAAEAAGLLPEMQTQLFGGWASRDPRAAFDFAVKQPPQTKDALMEDALVLLSNKYPALAGPEAAKLPDGPVKVRVLGRLIPEWVKADAASAAAWVQKAASSPHTALFAARIWEQWARTNPDGAAARAQQLPDAVREAAIISAFQQWARIDRNAASAAAAALPNEADRNAAAAALSSR